MELGRISDSQGASRVTYRIGAGESARELTPQDSDILGDRHDLPNDFRQRVRRRPAELAWDLVPWRNTHIVLAVEKPPARVAEPASVRAASEHAGAPGGLFAAIAT